MASWVYHLPVGWMAVVVFGAAFLVAGIIYAVVLALATGARARAFKAMSPVMLTPLAVAFGLLIGFLAAQVWSDVDHANAAVIHEASALRNVVLLAGSFPDEEAARIRAFVRRHILTAVEREWPAMAQQRATMMITAGDVEALQLTLSVRAQTDAQHVAQEEMVDELEAALDARRQRIIVSQASINGVKWSALILLAVLILVTIAIVHSDNSATAAIAMAIFTIGVAGCIVLIASHNRPFTGDISIGPDLLLQVMPEP